MKKDVIYIDIEDDITSIIEKVKTAQVKIVALVPPKRIGVLQSVVNLKLLQRAAQAVDKRVVLITNDPSLTSLAAGVLIPVAKNLQSKPEIASVPTLEIDDEDIINGDELSIGELSSNMPLESPASEAKPSSPVPNTTGPVAALAAANAPKKGPKIPNFDKFRKKVFIFGGLGIVLAVFLVWAIFFAGHATVSITARTTSYNVGKSLKLATAPTPINADAGIANAVVKEISKTTSVDFTATGKKEVGDKASGQVVFRNCETFTAQVIDAGTVISADGFSYVTQTAVTVPGGTGSFISCTSPGVSSAVAVVAQNIGEEYNADSGKTYSVGGHSNSSSVYLRAVSSTAMAGGTKKTVTVVSADDIAKAKEKLVAQDATAVKTELKKQFDATFIVIDESFVTTPAEPTSAPAVDQEATTAKLTAETKFSIAGMLRTDINTILTANIMTQLAGLPNQKIFDTGINKVSFSTVTPIDGGYTATLQAVGYVGPNIDTNKLASQLVGKRSGEIQAEVQAIDGVQSVDVNLSPFWVSTAPSKDKITIKFLIKNETN